MNRVGAVLSLFILLMSLASPAHTQTPREWFISTQGRDTTGDGSAAAPFQTIQHGIIAAQDGDTVTVLPGEYSGPGNAALDFNGKVITLRSSNPQDSTIVKATILNAAGQAVIARFIHDEGPGTIFEGFTLMGGERNPKQARGVPGFFEFSSGARPTTRLLRVLPAPQSERSESELPAIEAASIPYGTMAWDGLDPFHQPASTTRYLGSGDVNRDGSITQADVTQAAQMASGSLPAHAEADVNEDGAVTQEDVQLIASVVNGASLPGHWNELQTRAERDALIDRVLSLDPTNNHVYNLDWFVCYEFAAQLYTHATFVRADLSESVYDGGQTHFNLPVYMVSIYAGNFGHAINAILVGDDPLNFNDWRLIEPQYDNTVVPGAWDLPIGSNLTISAYDQLGPGLANRNMLVEFDILETGSATLVRYNPNLRLQRGSPESQAVDNKIDTWNPHILPVGNGTLVYERQRDDLSLVTSLYASSMPFSETTPEQVLTFDSHYTRWMDWTKGPDGKINLLWRGEVDGNPGIFSSTLNTATLSLENTRRVVSNHPYIYSARLIAGANELQAFWQKKPVQRDNSARGIYWSRLRENYWESYENLTPDIPFFGDYSYPGWLRRDFSLYFFDVAQLPSGTIILMWLKTNPENDNWQIMERHSVESGWSEPTQAFDANMVRGLRLKVDADGNLHALYWTGAAQDQWEGEGRGNLYDRKLTNGVWSSETVLDNTGKACCPDMSASANGLYAAWETRVDGKVVPAWSRYRNGTWEPVQTLTVRDGAEAWYPSVTVLPSGSAAVAWSSRSTDFNRIETQILYSHAGGDFLLYFPQMHLGDGH